MGTGDYFVCILVVSSFLEKLCYQQHRKFTESEVEEGSGPSAQYFLTQGFLLLTGPSPSPHSSGHSLKRRSSWAPVPSPWESHRDACLGSGCCHPLTVSVPLLEWLQPVDRVPEPGNSAGADGGEECLLWHLQHPHSL